MALSDLSSPEPVPWRVGSSFISITSRLKLDHSLFHITVTTIVACLIRCNRLAEWLTLPQNVSYLLDHRMNPHYQTFPASLRDTKARTYNSARRAQDHLNIWNKDPADTNRISEQFGTIPGTETLNSTHQTLLGTRLLLVWSRLRA